MSIEAQIIVTVAAVEVTDQYRVALRTHDLLTDLHPDDAVRLADELYAAAGEAMGKQRLDGPREAHAFDVAPICRECTEGKHGACNGQALLDREWGVEVHACGCSEVDHKVLGGAA